MYVNGLGFVNDSASVSNITTNKAENKSNTANTSFDDMLKSESAKYNKKTEGKTYDLKAIFEEASQKYNVSYDMLTSIAWHESRFKPDVTSSAGAMGLMQLMPGTAEAMGITDGYDPYQNVMGAAKLLGRLSEMYNGDTTLTLAAYAAGSGSVAKYGGVPPYGETQEFVSTITKMLNNGGAKVPDEKVTVNEPHAESTENNTNAANSSNDTVEKASNTAQAGNDIYTAYEASYASAAERIYNTNKDVYDKFYQSSNLDNVLSYSDYQMLMYYYEHMMEIISNIGKISDDVSTSSSLSSLLASDTSDSENVFDSFLTSATADKTETTGTLPDSGILYNALNNSTLEDANAITNSAIISSTIYNRITELNNE